MPASSPGIAPPSIYWEPDNLRGRALASFDAQVASPLTLTAGTIAPFDYLVGTRINRNFGSGFRNDGSTGTQYFMQPVVFSCPGNAIFPGPSGVAFCGTTSASQVADVPVLGTLRTTSTQLLVSDPATVGQGFSSSQLTSNPLNTPVTGTANLRLFVGDSRPQQVMFREGLLYVARTVRSYDTAVLSGFTGLNSSTVLYELIKTCAASGPVSSNGNTAPNCGAAFSPTGGNITAATSAMSGIWTNSTNVPDPAGNGAGFGFYQPMFDVPADVLNSQTGGPTPPTNTFPWLENVFVGMTTGGTSNVASTFSKNYASLWDFRPGDDAYDTALPYLDPYSGVATTTVPCPNDVTVQAIANKTTYLQVADATGLQVGMYLSGTTTQITAIQPNGTGGATITLSAAITNSGATSLKFSLNPQSANFTINQIVDGSTFLSVSSTAGLQVGQVIASTAFVDKGNTLIFPGNTSLVTTSASQLSPGEIVSAAGAVTVSGVTTITGAGVIAVPGNTQVAVGEAATSANFPNTTVTALALNADGTLQVTLGANATASGSTSVNFDPGTAPLEFAANTVVSTLPGTAR